MNETEEITDLEKLAKRVNTDPVAYCWFREIRENTELTNKQILGKMKYIQKNGRGCLVSTNSIRIPLAHIAEDYEVKLRDGYLITAEEDDYQSSKQKER